MMEFLNMGGYAFYVWSAYGIASVVILGNVWIARSQSKQIHDKLRRKALQQELEQNNEH